LIARADFVSEHGQTDTDKLTDATESYRGHGDSRRRRQRVSNEVKNYVTVKRYGTVSGQGVSGGRSVM